MTRYYVYHWYGSGSELEIPGVFQEGEANHPGGREPHWIEIADAEFGNWIKNLAEKYDVMLRGPTTGFQFHSIYVARKGGRFR